jgi:hypothetical protein
VHDLVIVGTGVLGRALGVEAQRLGLDALCVGPSGVSPSFVAGRHFRLNTWTRPPDQHPGLSRELRKLDRALFPQASSLEDASRRVFAAARVPHVAGLARSVTRAERVLRVHVDSGRTLLARRVLLCPGWGPLKNTLQGSSAAVLGRALRDGSALDFSAALRSLSSLPHPVALVGAGPSALSFLEALTGPVVWVSGGPVRAPEQPRLARMFGARYREVLRTVWPSSTARVVRLTKRRGTFELGLSDGEVRQAKTLVWCGGFEAPLKLLGAAHRVLDRDGARLGLKRRSAQVFQVGPALDQLGLADWDLGPYAEWYEKGKRLLHRWSEASSD